VIRFKKTDLPNGIRVVSELHSESRAVSLGVWVLTGTRDENLQNAGISHFIEHLVFKGTKNRSSYQIAKSLEALGGELNAFTTREYTCYHALILKDHWAKGMEVLADLVSNMSLTRNDFQLEKSVILQEIAMCDDNLEELIYDEYFLRALPRHPLGKPILGNSQSIGRMTQREVMRHYREKYCGQHLIVSATGNIDHEELVKSVRTLLGHKKKTRRQQRRTRPRHSPFRAVIEKPVEQLHLLLGIPGATFRDRLRFEAFIVNALLGGGMTSRLYQSVREKKGLVYTIYSSLNTFEDFGLINIYAACEKKNMKQVIRSLATELGRVQRQGISESDLELFKTQVKGSLLLGADDIENRMQSIGVNEMVFKKYKPVDEIIAEIDQVTVKSVREYLKKYFDLSRIGVILMGGGAEEMQKWLEDFDFEKN
jgi:predicted Zn-dependent peptidase